jgi:hypothetical protein
MSSLTSVAKASRETIRQLTKERSMDEKKIDPAKEEAYWREKHDQQSYAAEKYTYEHYAPAYRTGIQGAVKHAGKEYDEIEDDLALDYEKHRVGSPLPWDEARHAVRAAWDRLAGVIGPRDPTRGIRSGL